MSSAETSTKMIAVTEETPQFKNISIDDIIVNGALQAVLLQGLPEMLRRMNEDSARRSQMAGALIGQQAGR